MKHEITNDYYRLAAGFYQSAELPEKYLEIEEEDFHKLLEANAWKPFEGHRGENIALFIENLSVAMENIAREARKKTLDEVKDKLNIK